MTCKKSNLAGKVGAHTVCPLLGNLHACSDASIPLELECSEILEDKELIYVLGWFILFVGLLYVTPDLIPQVLPPMDIFLWLWQASAGLQEVVSSVAMAQADVFEKSVIENKIK